ncbi:hypothetical protein O181_014765 [Austropuccinia psidii MF-1]|uniref:Uncharacterized protein n=1 Tax=Austropuccinia psidii MF-1 TaxID=1389203 RepID=A0A9Q3C2H7_9BASI|nr:hypothetical protein [Austropuccinia psidii MF-1]
MQILTLVLVPCSSSHMNPCASPGSQHFTLKSLRLSRMPASHIQILMPVQVPKSSEESLGFSRLPMLHMQVLIPVQVPGNSNHSLLWRRLPMLHIIPYTTKNNSL